MSRSVIVTVGDELLAGAITDTNAAWLSRTLRARGFPAVHRETVPDDVEAVAAAVRRGRSLAPVVVVTGGLGPTADDLTRHGVARGLDRRTETSEEALGLIRAFFERHGREMPDRDRGQAELPEGAGPLPNAKGTAPGFVVRCEDVLVAVVPGPPEEMRPMVEEHVVPLLEDHPARGPVPGTREVTVVGLPESEIGSRLQDLLARGRRPRVGSYPRVASVVISLEAWGDDADEVGRLLAADVAEIRRRLGDHVLGEGRLDMSEVVGRRLIETGTTLAVAESLTGGRLSDSLVGVPGISAVFLAGLVTYSNASKTAVLGVSEETLRAHGAVSAECAREMARGARRVASACIGVSTTGIAGPTGDVPGKPVGTVFVGLAAEEGERAERRVLVGDRGQIRDRTVHWALAEIWKRLR